MDWRFAAKCGLVGACVLVAVLGVAYLNSPDTTDDEGGEQ